MTNKLTFNNSTIWPDNSIINWEMEGLGRVNGQVKFVIITNDDNGFEDSCFVQVIDDYPKYLKFTTQNTDVKLESKIFWNVTEWYKLFKTNPNEAMRSQHHLARQSAMQWAEDYFINNGVILPLSIS